MNRRRTRFKSDFYIKNILEGNRIILSRAITLIESTLEEDEQLAAEVLNGILPYSGKSLRIGLTGAPGVGKSSFIEALGRVVNIEKKSLAILTIDPSSPISSGSILGDKTRMAEISKYPNVFIRPSPSGKHLGGVSSKTRETILLCEAAGFENIIVETVGVGQSEITVKEMVDFFVLLLLPGGGDELQGIKKGIMEMADLLVITKADGDNIERANKARQDYENALSILHPKGKYAKVWSASSLTGYNVESIWEVIKSQTDVLKTSNLFYSTRQNQNVLWMHSIIKQKLQDSFYNYHPIHNLLKHTESEVLNNIVSPLSGALALLKEYRSNRN